ncbi:MAG TPA: MarR family transcriptional regulator [candidate division Zixibacteria bacterium]|nr:MarR family transcriptional regulator [candidate division Zixibacteria bacterium]
MAPLQRPQRTGPKPVDDLEARLIKTVPQVFRHLLAHARRRRAWQDLTYQQYNVLRIIQNEGPVPSGEVARRLLVTAPVVTRLARTLEEAGLVGRRPDPSDRRAHNLVLTAAGRRKVSAMRRDLLAAAAELIEPLPEGRRAAVAAALDELEVLLPGRATPRDVTR